MGDRILHVEDINVYYGAIHAIKDVSFEVSEGEIVAQQMTVEENLEMGAYTRPGSEIAPGLERVYAHFPRLKERRRQGRVTLSGTGRELLENDDVRKAYLGG